MFYLAVMAIVAAIPLEIRSVISPQDARDVTLALLELRAPEATICPSEVARDLVVRETATDWRDAMPVVHTAVDQLVKDGLVQLSWKGKPLSKRLGPYRIRHGVGVGKKEP